ncbi:BlaI/MecI/CopY family transcriptional regulator [Thermococcus sp.]|uniref:BlaI/MecI/CopY family transcriptional regulator n=1 Tax=Thermococcus sp. TaxID=35749 RepID=UPI0026189E65|nr:BlaI/MecI/CopY family transcriptional regulator [Thermococcus sp.]
MNGSVDLESEIRGMLRAHGELSVAFITRFLHERGLDCTRQGVERVLRRLVRKGVVEAFYTNGNQRKHYRLR